jgi:hypothetical protein
MSEEKHEAYQMKQIQRATHNHKRLGAVVVLQSTAELAQIVTVVSGDSFWVKVADLTQLAGDQEQKSGKGPGETSGTARR